MRIGLAITLVIGLLAAPLAAEGQQAAVPAVGVLSSASAELFAPLIAAFRDGLRDAGYIEGRNVTIEFAWAAGRYDRLPTLAEGLVARKVAVIFAHGGAVAALAAKAATSTIPIVIAIGDDPVKFGLVSNLGKPEGNITGVTLFMNVLTPKRLELLTELVPRAPLTMLVNPQNPNVKTETRDAREAAGKTRRGLRILEAGNDDQIAAAFATIAAQPGAALMITTDPFFYARRDLIVELAARHSVPTIYYYRGFALAGGLISYGATITTEYRTAGLYTGRLLSGAKPSNLPIVQPTKVELVINMKTAKALGLTIPQTLLLRADQVIE
jgi:putative tryptophan/tyrosine transport system substrate-binding protein